MNCPMFSIPTPAFETMRVTSLRRYSVLHRKDRRAFTLTEMLLSLTIIAIIMGALGSVVALAGRALSTASTGLTPTAATARTAVDMVTSDLQVATTITEQTATALTFTVPPRGADVSPETIRYAWDGVSGHSLTRQYNGGAAASIADNVTSLNFTYLTKTVAGTGPVPPTESAEQVLASYSSAAAGTYAIISGGWPAEWFAPSLPANAVFWKITRLKVRLQRNGGKTGILNVSIYAVNASNQPTGSALASGAVDISTVPTSATWVDVIFPSALAGLDPTAKMALVISTAASPTPGDVFSDSSPPAMSTMGWTTSTNSGTSWATPVTTRAMQYYVYGTISTPAP